MRAMVCVRACVCVCVRVCFSARACVRVHVCHTDVEAEAVVRGALDHVAPVPARAHVSACAGVCGCA